MNKITFVGVWMASDVGETVSFVIDTNTGERILVDCGTNLVKGLLDAKIDPSSITHVIVTHKHGDHIAGLPSYLFYRVLFAPGIYKKELKPLKIIGLPSVIQSIQDYIAIPYGSLANHPSLTYQSIEAGKSFDIAGESFSFFSTTHPVETVGFKVTLNNKIVVYSSDTAFSESVLEEARNCDYLIHDIAATSDYPFLAGGHTLCNQISPVLDKYGVKALVPVHRVSTFKENPEKYLQELRQHYKGKILMKNDGDTIEFA